MSFITIKDVREYVQDRSARDNPRFLDLRYADDDIMAAMTTAARDYNSLPPTVDSVTPQAMPGETNMFLDATAAALFRRTRIRMTENQVEYTGGSVAISDAPMIAGLEKLEKECYERFVAAARTRKITINIRAGFGNIG